MARKHREPKPHVIEETAHYRVVRVSNEFYVYDADGTFVGARGSLNDALALALTLAPAPDAQPEAAEPQDSDFVIEYDPASDKYIARDADGEIIAAGASYYAADAAAMERRGWGGARPGAGRPPSSGAAIDAAVRRVIRAAQRGALTAEQRAMLLRTLEK